jgi:hypothetical protein
MSRLTKSCYAHEQNDIRVTFDEKNNFFRGKEQNIVCPFANMRIFL